MCRNAECTKPSLELRQTVSLVYDIVAFDNEVHIIFSNPSKVRDFQFVLQNVTLDFQDWSTRKLFGIGLRGACPLATLSNIYLDLTSNGTTHNYLVSPQPDVTTVSLRGGQENKFGIYDVRTKTVDGALSIATVHIPQKSSGINYPSILYANRYITGKYCTS